MRLIYILIVEVIGTSLMVNLGLASFSQLQVPSLGILNDLGVVALPVRRSGDPLEVRTPHTNKWPVGWWRVMPIWRPNGPLIFLLTGECREHAHCSLKGKHNSRVKSIAIIFFGLT